MCVYTHTHSYIYCLFIKNKKQKQKRSIPSLIPCPASQTQSLLTIWRDSVQPSLCMSKHVQADVNFCLPSKYTRDITCQSFLQVNIKLTWIWNFLETGRKFRPNQSRGSPTRRRYEESFLPGRSVVLRKCKASDACFSISLWLSLSLLESALHFFLLLPLGQLFWNLLSLLEAQVFAMGKKSCWLLVAFAFSPAKISGKKI